MGIISSNESLTGRKPGTPNNLHEFLRHHALRHIPKIVIQKLQVILISQSIELILKSLRLPKVSSRFNCITFLVLCTVHILILQKVLTHHKEPGTSILSLYELAHIQTRNSGIHSLK